MSSDELLHALQEAILGPAIYTSRQLSEDAGTPLEAAEELWMGLGFSPVGEDEVHFTREDRDILAALVLLSNEGLAGPEVTVPMTRVLGQALSRVASAQAEAFQEPIREALDGIEHGREAEETLGAINDLLVPSFELFISYIWRRHLVAAIGRALMVSDESVEVVGFADLVNFTRETRDIDDDALTDLIDRFQRAAYENVTEHHGRVVKVIGDGLMFTAPDVEAAANIALGLVGACEDDDDLLGVRVGLASGPTVPVEGDLYGETVNRASRLSDVARPQSVVADNETGHLLLATERFDLSRMRARKLKGLGPVSCWAVRPGRIEGEGDDGPDGRGGGRGEGDKRARRLEKAANRAERLAEKERERADRLAEKSSERIERAERAGVKEIEKAERQAENERDRDEKLADKAKDKEKQKEQDKAQRQEAREAREKEKEAEKEKAERRKAEEKAEEKAKPKPKPKEKDKAGAKEKDEAKPKTEPKTKPKAKAKTEAEEKAGRPVGKGSRRPERVAARRADRKRRNARRGGSDQSDTGVDNGSPDD